MRQQQQQKHLYILLYTIRIENPVKNFQDFGLNKKKNEIKKYNKSTKKINATALSVSFN